MSANLYLRPYGPYDISYGVHHMSNLNLKLGKKEFRCILKMRISFDIVINVLCVMNLVAGLIILHRYAYQYLYKVFKMAHTV